jgi:hypothetical protein
LVVGYEQPYDRYYDNIHSLPLSLSLSPTKSMDQ